MLSKEKSSGEIFAIKVISKEMIIEKVLRYLAPQVSYLIPCTALVSTSGVLSYPLYCIS